MTTTTTIFFYFYFEDDERIPPLLEKYWNSVTVQDSICLPSVSSFPPFVVGLSAVVGRRTTLLTDDNADVDAVVFNEERYVFVVNASECSKLNKSVARANENFILFSLSVCRECKLFNTGVGKKDSCCRCRLKQKKGVLGILYLWMTMEGRKG